VTPLINLSELKYFVLAGQIISAEESYVLTDFLAKINGAVNFFALAPIFVQPECGKALPMGTLASRLPSLLVQSLQNGSKRPRNTGK